MTERRSVCPIACTLDLVGDRWTLLVVRDLACGKSHFKDFLGSPEGIATNILANRLNRLVEAGVAEKFSPDPNARARDAYRLTPKGKSLVPVLRSMVEWGLANIDGTHAHLLSGVPADAR